MSDEPMPAWAAAWREELTGRLGTMLRVSERTESKVDNLALAVRDVQVRLTSLETTMAQVPVLLAAGSARMDALEARLVMVEKRLELRDGGQA